MIECAHCQALFTNLPDYHQHGCLQPTSNTPAHYAGTVTPWDLQKCMRSTGDAFIDARRTDAIEYAFRLKDNPREDWQKAIHCLQAAIDHFDKNSKKKA